MKWCDYIRKIVTDLIPYDLPVYFWWDYKSASEEEYVVFQTEQLDLPQKRASNWFDFLDKAVKVYDYSALNKKYYPSEFLPIYPDKSSSNTGNDIDVLFYGYMTPRREKIVNDMGATVINTLDMNVLKGYINKSKKVLSFGCYDNRYADPLRVVPALNMGANIITEHTEEKWLEDYLINNMSDRITFI